MSISVGLSVRQPGRVGAAGHTLSSARAHPAVGAGAANQRARDRQDGGIVALKLPRKERKNSLCG